MGYDAGKLNLEGQPMAGRRSWVYDDTGGESVATYEGAGFFTDANDLGVNVGDPVEIVNRASDTVYRGRFTAVQDTGETQGTVVLDTGPDIPG